MVGYLEKTSGSELSKTLNSMYEQYEKAETCYALLSDDDIGISKLHTASSETALASHGWFSHGWCLKEILATRNLVLSDAKWY